MTPPHEEQHDHDDTEDAIVTILHLSDFHFEAERTRQRKILRQTANESMLQTLREIIEVSKDERDRRNFVNDWSPHVVAVSGDIAYSGSDEDYELASIFFTTLLNLLHLDSSATVFCPGNHDRNMRAGLDYYPDSVKQSDDWLSAERLRPVTGRRRRPPPSPLVLPFVNFVRFCDKLGAMKAEGLPGLEYLTGSCQFARGRCTVEFVVLNSAWFSSPGPKDIRNLWLGLPLLEAMQLGTGTGSTAPDAGAAEVSVPNHRLRVGLCHHPRDWLHPEEHNTYSDRPNTFAVFAKHCDVILNGHVHGALESPTLAYNSAQTFTGGASYASGRYRNNFSIIQINLEDNSARRRGFEYDPRESVWQELTAAAGTYQIVRPDAMTLPETGPIDLCGQWQSVFWFEYHPSVRKDYDKVVIVRGENGTFVTDIKQGEPGLHLCGELRGGFFSGSWRDEKPTRDGKPPEDFGRFGTFQLKVCPGGTKMLGRWLGFDKTFNIRVGHWQFRLVRGSTKDVSNEQADG